MKVLPMPYRVTVVIDQDLDKKIRARQVKQIVVEQKSISYSRVLNDMIRKGFDCEKTKS